MKYYSYIAIILLASCSHQQTSMPKNATKAPSKIAHASLDQLFERIVDEEPDVISGANHHKLLEPFDDENNHEEACDESSTDDDCQSHLIVQEEENDIITPTPPCIQSLQELLIHKPPSQLAHWKGIEFEQFNFTHYKVKKEFRQWFGCRIQKQIHEALSRSEQYYFPLIETIAQQYHPDLLDAQSDQMPIIKAIEAKMINESLAQTNAISWAGAAGPWQFMRSTFTRFLKRLNLEDQYPVIDHRFDWHVATRAALELNIENFKLFAQSSTPFTCSLMAYNAGVSRVKKALRRQRKNNCSSLRYSRYRHGSYIRTETYRYEPRIILVMLLRVWREKNGYQQPVKDQPPGFFVSGQGCIEIQKLAQHHNMKPQTLLSLNRKYLMGYTPFSEAWQLRVPANMQEQIQTTIVDFPRVSEQHINRLSRKARNLDMALLMGQDAFRYYRIRNGDTVSQICHRFRISMWKLYKLNESLFKRNRRRSGQKWAIYPGQRLRLPALHKLINNS